MNYFLNVFIFLFYQEHNSNEESSTFIGNEIKKESPSTSGNLNYKSNLVIVT